MKNLFKFKSILTTLLTLVFLSGCSLFDLDINENPNSPSSAAPDLILTQVQVDVLNTFAGLEGDLETFNGFVGTQSLSLFGLSANSYSGTWNALYTGPLKDLEGLISVSQSSPHYLGVAQCMKAYTYSTMVDLWGDLPFKDASKGDNLEKNTTPNFDKDVDIYNACFGLLDAAIANFAKPSPAGVLGDIMYSGSIAKWTKFANSIKLRMLISGRLAIPDAAAKVKAILDAGNVITAADDFTFKFSKDPTSFRHPWYTGAYSGGEFDYTYICHQPVVEMLDEEDPRFPFYFRRQSKSVLNPADPADKGTIPVGSTYGYLVLNQNIIKRLYTDKGKTFGQAEKDFLAGLFGRDRGDNTGIAADGALRLLPGVYPCGGYYDRAVAALPAANAAPGGGIFPALTSVNIDYYKLEAILKLGYTGDASVVFKSAIEGHIKKVVDFGMATDAANAVRPTQAAIDKYVTLWVDRFNAASSTDAKLAVALKQLWFSSFGNGFDFFNAFRRTGLPTNIQEHIVKPFRGFPLRLPYTQTELTLNPNASAYKNVAFDVAPIFWDK
jgi:Starch-binding associating with outer membrane